MYFNNKIRRLLPFLFVDSADAVCRLARDWSKKTLFPLGNFPQMNRPDPSGDPKIWGPSEQPNSQFPLGNFPQMKRQGGPATPAGEVAREHFSASF